MPGSDLNFIKVFKLYSGNATFMLLFAVSLIYLWIFERDRVKKAVLVFTTSALGLLVAFPLFARLVMYKFDEMGTYYRFIWLLPTGIVSSYAIVLFIGLFLPFIYIWQKYSPYVGNCQYTYIILRLYILYWEMCV